MFRLFFYVIGTYFYKIKISSYLRLPHHERTSLMHDIIGFIIMLQDSYSVLVGTML